MPIKLLQHKSWHVYNQENVARVKRDEARAAQEQNAHDERAFQAEAEARLDRLRTKSKRKRDQRDGPGEKELERQLAGKSNRGDEATKEQDEGAGDHARAIIVRPEGWDAKDEHGRPKKHKKDDDAPMMTNGHLNFWAELEAGAQAPASVLEKRLEKVLAAEPDDSLTKVYLAKKGEGDPKGWYASPDGKTERERKEPVETTLERTYRDNESKRLDDPLAVMNSYLKHRDHIKSGKPLPTPRTPSTRDRYIEPTAAASRRSSAPGRSRDAWDDTPRSSVSSSTAATEPPKTFEPVVPRLLPPKHKRPSGSSLAALSATDKDSKDLASSAMRPPSTSSHGSSRPTIDPAREAASRVGSERARAAALLASRRRAALAAASGNSDYSPSVASSPARSEIAGGWGMYNREEVLAARGGGGGGAGRQSFGLWGAQGRDTGGWGERKERRQERHRQSWHGGDRDSGYNRDSHQRSS